MHILETILIAYIITINTKLPLLMIRCIIIIPDSITVYELTTSPTRSIKKQSYIGNHFLSCLPVNIERETNFLTFKVKLKKLITHLSLCVLNREVI